MKTTTIGNDALYRRGRQLADQIVPLVASGVGRESALRRAAAASGLSVEDAKAADGFRKAADRIAKDAGPRAMAMILSGRGRLAPELVVKISNTHRERREFAMFRLAQGLDPFDKAIAWKAPPFDTGDYRVALDRVSLSAGLLDRAAAGLARASVEDLIAIGDHLAAARAFDAATSAALGGGAGGDPRPPAPAPGPRRPARRPTDPPPVGNKDARRLAHKVRGLAARNVRDTPRLMTEAPPTDAERDALLAALATSGSASEALSRLIEARIGNATNPGLPSGGAEVVHAPDGPEARSGTYVMIYHNDAPTIVDPVGRLGTFRFPRGYYLYVGSARGGVRGRHGHHLNPEATVFWNLDFMKPHFRPVGRWWSFDPGDRECTWASVLARSSGLSCPAPDFGAHCGRRCPAHLFHSRTMPRPEDFASGLRRREPGHDPVYYQRPGEG